MPLKSATIIYFFQFYKVSSNVSKMMWKTTVTCIMYKISLRIQQWNNFEIIVEVMIKNQVSFLEDSVYSSDCLMIGSFVFGRPFVKRFALCYRTVVCPVCLWRWYCGRTVWWMWMPLGREVDLGPGHIVLYGDPAPPPTERGTAVLLPIFCPCLLWPIGRPSQLLLSSCNTRPVHGERTSRLTGGFAITISCCALCYWYAEE